MQKIAREQEIIFVYFKSYLTLTNSIKPFIMDSKYIQYTYDLHIGVGIKFQSHSRCQLCWQKR